MNTPNQRLRAVRLARHLSQAEFAEAVRGQARALGLNLACDEKRIGRWERGLDARQLPGKAETLEFLAGCLVSGDVLVTIGPLPKRPRTAPREQP